MSFDFPRENRPSVAVIGGGISGIAAAYLLAPQAQVTLIESQPRLGGHARTVLAGLHGDQPVDTGFIVFNYVNYPHLTRLFQDLDVPVEKSDMSFGASIDNGRIEYALASLGSLVGQKRNLLRPGFYRMVRDILTFNARAESVVAQHDITTGELIDHLGLGPWFEQYYLLPICGAIWSTPTNGIRDFPARSLVRFFSNHALMSAKGQHQWWTVKGGSMQYVQRLESALMALGVTIRTNTPVTSVDRRAGGATVMTDGQAPETFDHVVFACHSDDALHMLADPSAGETRALSALRYQDNDVILHADTRQMPRRRACWSSWVYQSTTAGDQHGIGVTYWMNRLQNIPQSDPLFITLNPQSQIDERLVYDVNRFRHPVFDSAAIAAQADVAALQGQQNTWYAGAYLRHGFHEDGFASAHRVARGYAAQARQSALLDKAG